MNHLLKHRCTIRRSTPQNDEGVITHQWADVATDVACLIQEGDGRTRKNEAGQTYTSDSIAFFPPETDIRPNAGQPEPDLVVMTEPPRLAGVVYRVEHVADEAGQGHHLLANLKRLPNLNPG